MPYDKKDPMQNTTGDSVSSDNGVNLTKYLADAGVAARRKCADLIKAGVVRVNGTVCTNPGTRITDSDQVICEGKKVHPATKKYYILLHKPRGYVCTSDDIHAAKKAVDLINLPGAPRLFSAGRLDKDSEGLILFSNDGAFTAELTHPRHQVIKTYEVSLEYPLSGRDTALLCRGIQDGGEKLRARAIRPLGGTKYQFLLGEGKNREIRRMAAAVGNDTRRLKRVAVGRLQLGALPSGCWRELSKEECRLALELPVGCDETLREVSAGDRQ